jgi:hypothetical protein
LQPANIVQGKQFNFSNIEHFLEELIKRIGKPYSDLEFLLECFSEVLRENIEPELATWVLWISENRAGRILNRGYP